MSSEECKEAVEITIKGPDHVIQQATAPKARTMYVSVGAEKRVAVVQLAADGKMSEQKERSVALQQQTLCMTFHRASQRLFVGLGNQKVAVLQLGDGTESVAATGDLAARPVFLETANDGATLISAYFGADKLQSQSATAPFGVVSALDVGNEPHQALLAPNGLLYVAHRRGDVVQIFRVGSDGALTQTSSWDAKTGDGPRHFAFHATNAYLVNEFANTITIFDVASGTGALSVKQTISTLPDTFQDSNTGADIHVTKNGKFVYASNRGHDSIAMFARAEDGKLTQLGHIATQEKPREFSVSEDDRLLVACGQGNGKLESYLIGDDGHLTSTDVLEVGGDLRWVILK